MDTSEKIKQMMQECVTLKTKDRTTVMCIYNAVYIDVDDNGKEVISVEYNEVYEKYFLSGNAGADAPPNIH